MPMPPLVEPVADLPDDERTRTARHASLAGFGDEAQRRLAAAHVAVVGAGGLGSPTVMALAAAGVGALTVIDDDEVEASNLQRQVMHRVTDVGRAKVASAVRVAADLSPHTVVHVRQTRLTPDNAIELLSGAHVVVDGTDTFETRTAVADACERLGVPLVWGVVQEFHAQATVFWSAPPAGTPPVRLRDLYPAETVGELPTCAAVGVLGSLCLQVGALLATETVKLITGVGEPLLGRVAVMDALRATSYEVPLRAASRTEEPAAPLTPEPVAEDDPIRQVDLSTALAARDAGATLLDVREPFETATGILPGAVELPLAQVLADPAAAGPGPIVVVCKVGIRAERAARALRTAGVEASVLAGGMDAWAGAALERTGA